MCATRIPGIETIARQPKTQAAETILRTLVREFPGRLRPPEGEQLVVFDTLAYDGAYFPSAHTDIEWNRIRNEGFQVWTLVRNDRYEGNMYILHNPYLSDRYRDTAIYLRCRGDQVCVVKNCYDAEFGPWLREARILERIPMAAFLRTTKKFYLHFLPGDTVVFTKNTLHMSDYRARDNNRRAINFRVVVTKDRGKLVTSDEWCGYVHRLPHHATTVQQH